MSLTSFMETSYAPYVYALFTNLCFAAAAVIYSLSRKKVSAVEINSLIVSTSFITFSLLLIFTTGLRDIGIKAISSFMLSGLIALNFGDLFLLNAFSRIGAAPTFILFGFQPLLLGSLSYILFHQEISPYKFIAIIFLIGCLFCFLLENFKKTKTWEFKGIALALIGVLLDTFGILLTRYGFETTTQPQPIEAAVYRSLGALLGFGIIFILFPFSLEKYSNSIKNSLRPCLAIVGLCGLIIPLFLMMMYQVGHLASVSAIAITCPFFAHALECIHKKEKPSLYMAIALILFTIGFSILMLS